MLEPTVTRESGVPVRSPATVLEITPFVRSGAVPVEVLVTVAEHEIVDPRVARVVQLLETVRPGVNGSGGTVANCVTGPRFPRPSTNWTRTEQFRPVAHESVFTDGYAVAVRYTRSLAPTSVQFAPYPQSAGHV